MPLIELAGLGRAFATKGGPVRVLKDVSVTIDSGEFVCLTGPSGAGKSTLLNIIGCLDRPPREATGLPAATWADWATGNWRCCGAWRSVSCSRITVCWIG